MTSFYYHLCWFTFFLSLSLLFLILAVFLTLTFSSFSVSFDLFSSWFINLSFSVSFDLFSSWFSFTVTFISSIIMVYSYFYIIPYSKSPYFVWLTSFFVFSMLVVINVSNLFYVMLGWDGLGLVSFFLIVYYQNHSSIYSGLFTVLINRVGDCFFILSISLIILNSPVLWDSFSLLSIFTLLTMMLAFITNSAIYPFSPWLPLAIAAPTPISALVHSSTLVTAGLYLLIRFSYVFYSNVTLINIFLVLSIFTSFYAGINSIFEIDINNLIALSTLSHLGFIGMAYSSGLLYLSFFHLLVHALFNSLLFIAIGDVITNLFHSQDIRFLSGGYNYTTSSYYTIVLSFLNLLGMPSISGYYSNDLVLETLNFTSFSFFILLVVYLNLFFTYYYTYQLFYYSFSSINLTPFVLQHPSTLIHSYLLLILGVVGVVFGWVWVNFVNFYVIHITTPLFSNIYPLLLSITVFSFLVFNLRLLNPSNPLLLFFFSNIMLLSCLIITLISNLYLNITFFSVKSFEQGFLDNVLNKSTSSAFTVVSSVVFKLLNLNSLLLSFFTLSTFIFFMFL